MGSAAHTQTMEDPAGASIADCTSRHILESAGFQSRGASCYKASSAAGRVVRAFFCLEVLPLRLSCEGSTERDTERQRQRQRNERK